MTPTTDSAAMLARLAAIANQDEAKAVTVRTDDLRAVLRLAADPPAPGVGMPGREEIAHAICPHIRQWCDTTELESFSCKGCPDQIVTPHGQGTQVCRLNANAAANDVLALLAATPSSGGGGAHALLQRWSKTW